MYVSKGFLSILSKALYKLCSFYFKKSFYSNFIFIFEKFSWCEVYWIYVWFLTKWFPAKESRAGKIRLSGSWKSLLSKPSSGERCAPSNFVLLCVLQGILVRLTCWPHLVPRRAPNEIGYGKIGYGQLKQCNNILQSPQEGLKGYPRKGNLDFDSVYKHNVKLITVLITVLKLITKLLRWIQEPHNI